MRRDDILKIVKDMQIHVKKPQHIYHKGTVKLAHCIL